MMRRLRTLVLALLVPGILLVGGPPDPAHSSPDPQRAAVTFVRHSGTHWVWFGPRAWDASYGTYGITVLGGRGATLDLGFSSTLCASGGTWAQSVTSYFAAKRREVRQSYGWTVTSTSRIVHPSGTAATYRRQVVKFTSRRAGVTYQGIGTFDYDFTQSVDGVNYCYQRSLAKASRKAAWKQMHPLLDRVHRSLAYSGPGAPGEEPELR